MMSRKYDLLFAVTGNPILHSKSPLIFNTIFRHLGIDTSHVYGRIAADTAKEAMFLFKELGLKGMNVTAPFKKSIMDYLDSVDPAAKKIGGVNTIVREDNYLKGYNTDYIGVTESLKKYGIDIKVKQCLVLGAGGAGRAAVYGLVKEEANVTVVNRTYEKAVQVSKELGCHAEKIEMLEQLLKKADILISTLSSTIDIIPVEWLRKELTVFDANYKKSPLTEKAEKKGCTIIKGEEWLLNQAIPAYKHFLGTTAEIQAKVFAGSRGGFFKKSPWPPEAKKNIALVGFMGSGKSFIGKILARRMGFSFKDLDGVLEAKAGRSIPEIFETEGEAVFRAMEKEILKEELTQYSEVVYACGGGVVLDEENREILKRNALVVWLYASIPTSLKRIPRGTRPLLDCEDPEKEARHILDNRLFRYARAADLVVGSEADAHKVAEKIHDEIHKAFDN